ncbi:MAG: hydrogenase formation protein HypD [Acidobacteria bacterium]|nr:MAG: hydrogenase formation protein HypD [Acidobacteriota bacterium]PIE90804.1 MAG: hydrogenase formation protein HypD [Acidobacteriota bacterium]
MKYIDEFRNPDVARALLKEIHRVTSRKWHIMEVCGGQTHSIIRHGIDRALPKEIQLVHGPGCPVCVTPLETIDRAIAIAQRPDVILTSFGDMLRVPGSERDLLTVRSAGGDIRMVYSALESVRIARENPDKEVVFLGIGFETTAPGNAMAILQAQRERLDNFSMLVSQVRVPPTMEALLSDPECQVDGFLAAGHVCSVMGWWEYEPIASKYHCPIVPTGFEPLDLLAGILKVIELLEQQRFIVENQYTRAVKREGNKKAQAVIQKVFQFCDQKWRGLGSIPQSGLSLREEFAAYDASLRFDVETIQTEEPESCISGQILQGRKKPLDCPAFGAVCTPMKPLGALMVSGEGACSAYYKNKRR